MFVQESKQIATEWVEAEGKYTPGFSGAFFHGSVNWLHDEDQLAPTSDLDIMLVLEDEHPPTKPGKFVYRGQLLEISYIPASALTTPQQVLGEYNLAGSFHTLSVIADPTGKLTELQRAVAAEYAHEEWVRTRAWQARDKVIDRLGSIARPAPFHEHVMNWLFGTGVMTHVLLVAGLRNPTVRLRYMAVRDLLLDYDRLDYHETLLAALGCANLSQPTVDAHMDRLAIAYDAAAEVIRTPFFFSTDFEPLSRPIAIDGSRELIQQGYHREAIFWMAATYSRCMMVFHADAPRLLDQYDPAYLALLTDLGVESNAPLAARAAETTGMLEKLWQVSGMIMQSNEAIVRH